MKHRLIILVLTVLAAATAMTLVAQPPEGWSPGHRVRGWDRVRALDTNGDGQVSREEFEKGFDVFAQLDQNGDGFLTEADFPGRGRWDQGGHGHWSPAMMAGGMIAMLADNDRDHTVTAAEWQELMLGIDRDGDDVISAAEWLAAHPKPEDANGIGMRTPSAGRVAEHYERISQALDKDGDGSFRPNDLEAIFAGLDQNSDGQLTEDEMPHGRRGMHRRP